MSAILQGLTEFLKSQKLHSRFHSNICTVYKENSSFIDICCYNNQKLLLKCYNGIGNGVTTKYIDLINPNSLDELLEIIEVVFA